MENQKQMPYYLGLDIGTDSVGYAVTDTHYALKKFRGEPAWGATTFETASLAEERRMARTARRRLDRRQQRVKLLSEIFAPEICRIDPNFFIRRKESALFAEDTKHGVAIFSGGITDREYHRKYPTIHHLIVDLMQSEEPRDIRLVYLACAWLVANRGHFLSEADAEHVGDFQKPYDAFCSYLHQDCECNLPWDESVSSDTIRGILEAECTTTRKKAMFVQQVFSGKKPSKKRDNEFPFSREAIVTLLSGGTAAPKDIFDNSEYAELDSVTLGMDEENFGRILTELGDDGALLQRLRAMYDCAALNIALNVGGAAPAQDIKSISAAKVAVYMKHAEDLEFLKGFIRKYKPKEYAKVFRRAEANNYTAYSYNLKNVPPHTKLKRAKKEDFSAFLTKIVKDVSVDAADAKAYSDMMDRLALNTFLPKQKGANNRVIPQQLYYKELQEILSHAKKYLPMLSEKDADGLTNEEKILSIFRFRIPYYVGPLNYVAPGEKQPANTWLKREPGKIYPWNFDCMVDRDESERRFIRRMTNTCTYLPGEDVLPYCSLLYSRFMVLNELNNLKINGHSIPVAVKQELYRALFEESSKKVTLKSIAVYLKSHGYMNPTDELSGVDNVMNANLRPYHYFRRLLESGSLTEEQVEKIINHAAYSEDKQRMLAWLEREYPNLPEAERQYIRSLKLKEFGRLSRKFLLEIMGCESNGTGEAFSIMELLWNTNENLMQLLSERYTFRKEIDAFAKDYYDDPKNRKTLSERLSDMYVSNAVKRQIIRALDVTGDVVKAMGTAPQKIFIEMARGATQEQKGKRTVSRKQQILDLYKQVKHEDVPALRKELEAMGDMADNRLQSDRLFLYYMQLGRCMYTGKPIELTQLGSKMYDIDHIYPQSKVKDDSILNNKVLVLSTANEEKKDVYPIREDIRMKMSGRWHFLRENGLINATKYSRLIRPTPFSDDELHQFIARQLVETRQSTKVVAQLLKERYPEAEIVYVKAGMVSEFRQEFDLLKCRGVNDLHHAKDAYLNIVVGNVYHEMFTRRWFDTSQKYNISVKKVFSREQRPYGQLVWRGGADVELVKKNAAKNAVHITQYALCRHSGQNGGLFDQQLVKAKPGLIPRKKDLDPAKYGGYNGSTTTYFVLVDFIAEKKKERMLFPVELMCSQRFREDEKYARDYIRDTLAAVKKEVTDIEFPLGSRILKINSVLSLDGFLVCITAGSVKDGRVGFLPLTQFTCSYETERYLKRLESIDKKQKAYPKYVVSPAFDGVSAAENMKLYDMFVEKLQKSVYAKRPGVDVEKLIAGRTGFEQLPIEQQCSALWKLLKIFVRQASDIDLTDIGESKNSFKCRKRLYLSGWKKVYSDVHIVDMSASGLFESCSGNLLRFS